MQSDIEANVHVGMTVRRPLIDIVVAIAAGILIKILEPLVPTHWGLWPQRVTTALMMIAGLYALYAGWRWASPRLFHRIRERRVERAIREHLLNLGGEFLEETNQNFVRGVANILHSLTDAKVIEVRSHNQCVAHVATLWTAANCITTDVRARRLSAWEGLQRLIGVQRDYVRICCALVDAASAAHRSHVQRQWDDIRDHANAVSRKLCELEQLAQAKRGVSGSRVYLESVPRAYLTASGA